MIIEQAIVRQVSCTLKKPYRLSSGDLHLFDPIMLELIDSEGRSGWGECFIVPGYTPETVEASWDAARDIALQVQGRNLGDAKSLVSRYVVTFPGVSSAAHGALDMLRADSPFRLKDKAIVPLLGPCQGHEKAEIQDEVEELLSEGFKTLKVKVGFRWQEDLNRLSIVQDCVAGRATIRLDANRGYNDKDGMAFGSRISPEGIELFEQPCGSDDWEANAAVAAVSTVPVMLDESIYGLTDIDRAAQIGNVGFVKLKLKKVGDVDELINGLNRISALGMTPVLGDGVSMETGCWMEACVATKQIRNAGEMNGFLKPADTLFENPLMYERGSIVIPEGYWPRMDQEKLDAHTIRKMHFRRP